MHHVIAEKALGRPLKSYERVYFIDGDRNNYEWTNLDVRESNKNRALIARYIQRIDKMMSELVIMKEALVDEFQRAERDDPREL